MDHTDDRRAALPVYAKIGDIAEAFGVTPTTVRRWVAEGTIPAPDYRPNRRVMRWSPAAYRNFLTFDPPTPGA